MEFSDSYPTSTEFPSIDLHYADKVLVQGNQATGFDGPILVEHSNDSTNVTQKDNLNVGSNQGSDTIERK